MNTPTHLIITLALRRYVQTRAIRTSGVLWGSIAPDIPLYLLSLGGYLYFRQYLRWSSERTFERMYGYLYFNDPVWISLHNMLHAPLILIPVIVIFARSRWKDSGAGNWTFWFASSCLLHAILDFGTHSDDGSLALFPLNWSFRFRSPVSYWDPKHFGREFMLFEVALNILLIALLLRWRRRRLALNSGH